MPKKATEYRCPFSGKPLEFKEFADGTCCVVSPHGWTSMLHPSVPLAKRWVTSALSTDCEIREEPHARGGRWFVCHGAGWVGKRHSFRDVALWWSEFRDGAHPDEKDKPGISSVREIRDPRDTDIDHGMEEISDSEAESAVEEYADGKRLK